MLQDVMQSPEPLCIEGLSSPIAAQILDYCDDGGLFGESLQSSEVSSCSATVRGSGSGIGATITTPTTTTTNAITTVTTGSSGGSLCCFDDGSFGSDFSPFTDIDEATLSALLDPQQPPNPDPDIASAGAYPSTKAVYPPYTSNQSDQLDQLILSDVLDAGAYTSYSPGTMVQLAAAAPSQQAMVHQQQGLTPVYEEDCLPPLPMGFMDPSSSTSCSFLDAGGFYQLGGLRVPLCGVQGEGGGQVGFYGGMMACPEPGMASQDLRDYPKEDCGSVGIYGTESMHRVYSSGDLQVIGDGQNLMSRCSAAPLPESDITALDESSFKVGRLSVEERKEKIHRYMKKRNERNFSKKIKYACRKTLADSRPRVRGRFAKNDEFGEAAARPSSSHHEFDDEEEVVVKEEDDMLDSSDILAHISGVNSFKYNYTLESWI